MKIKVVTFAALRDRLGFAEKTVDIEEGATVDTAVMAVFDGPPPRGLAFAVNEVYASKETALEEGDEVAILPPVAGGAPLLRVQADPIDVAGIIKETSHASCGAVLVFLGTAREIPGEELVTLEYEAYAGMAERFFAELAEEIRTKHGVEHLAIVHRTGALEVGEVTVAIVAASPHRGEGFDALRHAIERIKEKAPVWKKEVTRRGEHWVESEKMEGG